MGNQREIINILEQYRNEMAGLERRRDLLMNELIEKIESVKIEEIRNNLQQNAN